MSDGRWNSPTVCRTLVMGALILALVGGCGRPPQAAPENRRLIAALRTALSARNSEWLEQTAQQVETRHQEGAMSDAEYDAFRQIIEKAESGDWKGAEMDSFAFQAAQSPTREEVERLLQGVDY